MSREYLVEINVYDDGKLTADDINHVLSCAGYDSDQTAGRCEVFNLDDTISVFWTCQYNTTLCAGTSPKTAHEEIKETFVEAEMVAKLETKWRCLDFDEWDDVIDD